MPSKLTRSGIKSILDLGPGTHELEFVREQKPVRSAGFGATRQDAADQMHAALNVPCCVLRVTGVGEEVEDVDRQSAGSAPGTRFTATIDAKGKLVQFEKA